MNYNRTFGLVLSFLLLFVSVPLLQANEVPEVDALIRDSKARAVIVKRVATSVVHIRVEKVVKPGDAQMPQLNNPFDLFDEELQDRLFPFRQPRSGPPQKQREFRQEGMGSGSIISKDGYILTNNHVVGEADKIVVKLQDNQEYIAKLIGTDPQSDIAVIKIDRKDLPVLPMGNADEIDVGESVIAIGNPFGLTQTVTFGIISAKGRSNIGIADYEDFIQTDAAINPGNSGGPLINLNGEIIGVNTAIFSRSGGYQGIGFAVPINMARNIMEDLLRTGHVSRGWLGVGIQDISPDLAKAFNIKGTQGALITNVIPVTPAFQAGFQKGDVVVRFNDKPIKDANTLRNMVAETKVGTTANVDIVRKGKEKSIALTLSERPKKDQKNSTTAPNNEENLNLGIAVQDITPEIAKELELESDQGVVIRKVEPNSPAATAGLRPGLVIVEVNQNPVKNSKDFQRAIKEANVSEGILLLLQNREGSRFVILKKD